MLRSVVTWEKKEVWVEGALLRVAHLDGEKYTYPDNIEDLLHHLKSTRERIDVFTFLQHPPHTEPSYSFPIEWDNLAVMQIISFDHWWNEQLKSIGRNRARQAAKRGVVIEEIPFGDKLLHGIVEIHNETPIRQGRTFPHFGMDIDGARKYAGTFLDRSVFIGAFHENKLIGFIKLTLNEAATYACIVNILAMLKHRDKAPTNAMIAFAVKWCAERGISFLIYENFTYGRKPADSLSQFKEVNGFRRMDLPRYFVPLTPLGRVSLRFGLHRRLADYCPQGLLSMYRELRTWWLTSGRRCLAGPGRPN